MSEMPEKKVLKMALTKMKANAITAAEKYNMRMKNLNEFLQWTAKTVDEMQTSAEDPRRFDAMKVLLGNIGQQVGELEIDSIETINDWKTYTEVLENYSAELDGTLTKIFEDAMKQSEEQIEKQKELVGKKPEYTI